jgi:CHAT domain-containing protein
MQSLAAIRGALIAILVLMVFTLPLHAQVTPERVAEELKALNQSIAEGRIKPGLDRITAFRQQIDPQKDPISYWNVSRQLLDLLFQLEDTGQAEQVLKSIVEAKLGATQPAIFQWTQYYIGQWLFLSGHGIDGVKFLRALTDGDARSVVIPAQRAAAIILSKIELQRGNINQAAIWMRRAVIGVLEDKGAGTEEIVDTLTEYAEYLALTRQLWEAYNLYFKLAAAHDTLLPHSSPKYLHFHAMFLDVVAEVGSFALADRFYKTLDDDVAKVDLVAPSVRAELLFQGLYQLARSKSPNEQVNLKTRLAQILDGHSDLLKPPLYRLIFMYFALLSGDVNLAERFEAEPIAQDQSEFKIGAYKDALDSFIAARKGQFERSISLLEDAQSKIEKFHRQFEQETADRLPAISKEERVVLSAILVLDAPHAVTLAQKDTLFSVGQFLNRDRVKLGLNESFNRRELKSDLQREDALSRDRLRDLRDRLMDYATDSLVARVLPFRLTSVSQNNDFSHLVRLEDIEDKILAADQSLGQSQGENTSTSIALSDIQALLRPGEALLLHDGFPGGVLSQCVNSQAWSFAISARNDAEVAELVNDEKGLADAVHVTKPPSQFDDDSSKFPSKSSNRLFKLFFGGTDECLEGKAHVLLATDPDFFALPWNALLTDLPPQGQDFHFRDASWLAKRFAISLLPSVESLYQIRKGLHLSRAKQKFLGIGDPDLQGSEQTGPLELGPLFSSRGVANGAAIAKLARLPESADELRSEAAALGARDADLLLGAEATERSLRLRQLDDYRVISFATHAIVAGGIPGVTEPALVLTPVTDSDTRENGLLTISKIQNLTLDANLVILSACHTAASDGHASGRGLSGLADAFFFAGARAVAVTQWDVISSSAERLAVDLISQSTEAASTGVSEGLRKAMLDYISGARRDYQAHPRFWAPFIVAGDGAVRPLDLAQDGAATGLVSREWEHLTPSQEDLDFVGAARTPEGGLYAIGMEHPPSGEKRAGSYLAKTDANGEPLVYERDRSLAASSIVAVADQVAVLGWYPSEHKSAAVFRMTDSAGQLLWEHLEESGYWNFPSGVLKSQRGYLLVSVEQNFTAAENNSLVLTMVSSGGQGLERHKYPLAVRPDGVPPPAIAIDQSGNVVIAISGSLLDVPASQGRTWSNPQTATRRFCGVPQATEIFEVDQEAMDVKVRKVLQDLSIVVMTATDNHIFAAGNFKANCRVEERIRVAELSNALEPTTIFESNNVNTLKVHDMKATAEGTFLLGGLTGIFLPTAPTFALAPTSQPGSPQFDPWSESAWEIEWRAAAFVLVLNRNGVVLGDKVILDARGRSVSTLLPGSEGQYVAFGSAFGDRGWVAGIRINELTATFPGSAPK